MKILVLNCGSSSIKYQLFQMTDQSLLAKGIVEKVGMQGSFVKHEKMNGEKVRFEGEIIDHQTGIEYVLGILTSKKHGCITNLKEIEAVGHRVAHGGEKFDCSQFIDDTVQREIEKCIEIAPLHNPANLKGIIAMQVLIPDIRQVAVFDTAFHQTMPKHAYMYAIPYSLYKKYGIRRYGFHGTSHSYIAQVACEMLKVDIATQRIITCHLGNGASLCAIMGGKSIDTSMGFTPIEGLVMGSRSGDVDLGVVTFIMDKEEIGTSGTNNLFNKQSGLLGISGISSDMREVEEAAWNKNDPRAQLALDMFHYRIRKYIGSYAAVMGGVDILIFSGGIGENAPESRELICKDFEFMGMKFDAKRNAGIRSKATVISADDSKVKVLIIPTNEELVIARDTEQIISQINSK
jgi:acetate kinase